MTSIVCVSPFRCRMWALHDRLETHVTEETCREEIESIRRHGQLVPALGRALRGDPEHDVELIYGARRLFVARHLNRPLKVEIREISDRDAIIAMDIENRQRVDISAYERGMSYARWLRGGHFSSQEEIARALKVSPSQVSRLLKLAKLPTVVVAAFESAVDICEAWGLDLVDALDETDAERRHAITRKARVLGSVEPRPPAREVYRQLLSASQQGRRIKTAVHDEVVKDGNGRPLFRIRHQSNSLAVIVPLHTVSTRVLEELRKSISTILQLEGVCPNLMKTIRAATGDPCAVRAQVPAQGGINSAV
jgi:ParB family chromosome partitioning protein